MSMACIATNDDDGFAGLLQSVGLTLTVVQVAVRIVHNDSPD